MARNISSESAEVRVPTLLRFILLVLRALGAAPARLRRARGRWLLSVSPRLSRLQRLLSILICIVIVSAVLVNYIYYNTDGKKHYDLFVFTEYIRSSEKTVMFLTYILNAIGTPGRMVRIVYTLQQLQQITYRLDNCGAPTPVRTRSSTVTIIICYSVWQIFAQTTELLMIIIQISREKYWRGVIYILVFYMRLTVRLRELQWILTAVELNTAIIKLNDKIKSRLEDITYDTIESNFRLQNEFPRCYEVICDLVRHTNKRDGIFLLLTVIMVFLQILTHLTEVFSVTLTPTTKSDLGTWIRGTLDVVLSISFLVKLLIIVEPCHSIQYELELTYRLLSKISTQVKLISGQASQEVDQFLVVAQLRDAKFSPMGIFRITRSLVVSMIGSIITYLVIAIQTSMIIQ